MTAVLTPAFSQPEREGGSEAGRPWANVGHSVTLLFFKAAVSAGAMRHVICGEPGPGFQSVQEGHTEKISLQGR